MSGPQTLHNALLRPPIIQILRAAGFHSTRPSVLDTLADITGRYLLLLGSAAAEHAANSHPDDPAPTLADIMLALEDVGALQPQMKGFEEDWRQEEDMRGIDALLSWFPGLVNREIQRIAGFIPTEGDVVDADLAEKEDFLTAMKKKHSKTGEESRYAGTVIGKDAEEHPVIIEGGAAASIGEWASQIKSQVIYAESVSSAISSPPSSLSDEGMDI
ncbi:uncharacterized protein TRUGW13939_02370 [Talaromyces rugulosus]|uniref:Bromodomain associated domain-containing protein n=1 Tax=Talaromyces rugulosus TaxID=121627 RepID=A0A7H8QN20_TALRU|nr:uncharacterized protein TRUGW13939_02370 [Talaromyces rugulosus]QKX55278.1 hypothetical protein TRUGW13939_02370 [Talaromyces rugulosus]